jgi:hypothetical protein
LELSSDSIQWRDYSIEESLPFAKETFKGPCFIEVVIPACGIFGSKE